MDARGVRDLSKSRSQAPARASSSQAPAVFAFLNAHPEFNAAICEILGASAPSGSRTAFLRCAVGRRTIIVLDLSMYDLVSLLFVLPAFQKRIAVVHHNTALALNDSFLKRHVKALVFRFTRVQHVFLASNVARFHALHFKCRASFLPHPIKVRDFAGRLRGNDPALPEHQRGFISGHLNRRASQFLADMARRYDVDSRLEEHRGLAGKLPRFETMDELLEAYDFTATDIDPDFNRVSGIVFDSLGAGLTVYALSIPFLRDVSRYTSVERVDAGGHSAKKIRMNVRQAEQYQHDFAARWRAFSSAR